MEKQTSGQLHAGHRKRMEERFHATDKYGDISFAEHELLEMLLYFSIPRQNTNEIAHRLLSEFGSLRGVFEAPTGALKKVSGMGSRSAYLIRLVSVIIHAYIREPNLKNSPIRITKTSEIIPYLHNIFFGYLTEMVFVLLFNCRGDLISVQRVSSDFTTATQAMVCSSCIVQSAMNQHASFVILAHNHPSGTLTYSEHDLQITHTLSSALKAVGIQFLEHYIVTDHDCVGMIADILMPSPPQNTEETT